MDWRRSVRALICSAVAVPLAANAQNRATVRRIGFLSAGAPKSPEELQKAAALLRKNGWLAGQDEPLCDRRSRRCPRASRMKRRA